MCWVACDRLAKIADAFGIADRFAYWRRTANDLRTTILERAFDTAQNSFVSTLGGSDIDASLLLLQEIGFVSATDPRFLGTVAAVERVLRRGNHLLRYAAPDDFGVPHSRSPSARSGTSTRWWRSGDWTRRASCSSMC